MAEISVADGENKLIRGTDYSVEYTNNVNVGTATVTVTGTGKYAGTKQFVFNIVKGNAPAAPVGLSAVAASSRENNGKITGVTHLMEYSADGGTSWTPVPSGVTEITGLKAGIVKVRL